MDHGSKRKIHAHRFPTSGSLLALLLPILTPSPARVMVCSGFSTIFRGNQYAPMLHGDHFQLALGEPEGVGGKTVHVKEFLA